MTRLELYVRFTNGTGRTVAEERDDVRGRETVDRIAFEFLARDDVERCEVERSTRTAGYRSR